MRGVDAGPAAGAVEGGRPSAGFGAAAGTRCCEGAGFAAGTRCCEGAGFAAGTRPTEPAAGEIGGRMTPAAGRYSRCGAAARMTEVDGTFCSGTEGIGGRCAAGEG